MSLHMLFSSDSMVVFDLWFPIVCCICIVILVGYVGELVWYNSSICGITQFKELAICMGFSCCKDENAFCWRMSKQE
uniref:Uncharacterized protein n=1 Tax=Manihot esculenta TaxID=3983 RepID=A0A2C9VWR6_MANES